MRTFLQTLPNIPTCLLSSQQFHVQSDRAHEQIDIAQSSLRHVLRQRLTDPHRLHDTVFDANDQPLLLVGTRADAHGGQELPHMDVLGRRDVRVRGENIRQDRLDGVEQATVQFRPLLPVFLDRRRIGRGLFDQFGAGDEHGEDRNADLGPHDALHVRAIEDQTEKADDDVERRLVDEAEQRGHDGLVEERDFFLDASGDGGAVHGRICVSDHVEHVQMDRDESEHGQSLLFVQMAKDTWNGLFALGMSEDLDERVRHGGTAGRLAFTISE